jgi:putative two-component system response regulator
MWAKLSISDLILNKPDKLTDEEFAIIKGHCEAGEQIINKIIERVNDDVFLTYAKRFAAYHHEKWDGTGYPYKLSGEDIPLEGRIMAVADVYDALVTERPYKKAFDHEKAVKIIEEGSSTHFDPRIVNAFMNISDDFLIASTLNDEG